MPYPLFVFGLARSGTNLVTGMLNAHPQVALVRDPLMPFFKSLRDTWVKATGTAALTSVYSAGCSLQDYYFAPYATQLLDLTMSGDLNTSIEDTRVMPAIRARAALESEAFAKRLEDVSGATFREILDGILSQITKDEAEGLAWSGTKEVWTSEFLPVLARAYPDAKFIIILRDPRAILASMLQMGLRDPTQAAHSISYMRHWRKHIAVSETLLATPEWRERILLVRYEHLAQNPHESMHGLAAFLDLDPDPAMLNPVLDDHGKRNTNSSYGEFRGISTDSIDRWHTALKPMMRQTIEYICGPEMLAAGYLPLEAHRLITTAELKRVVEAADREPGSWRSDRGTLAEQLTSEAERWSLLKKSEPIEDPVRLRRSFLFVSFFRHLQKRQQQADGTTAANQWKHSYV